MANEIKMRAAQDAAVFLPEMIVASGSRPLPLDGELCAMLGEGAPRLSGGGSGFGVINPPPGFCGGWSGTGNGPLNPPGPGQPGYVQLLW